MVPTESSTAYPASKTGPSNKKPGRPPRIRQEQLAVTDAEELLRSGVKLKPALRTRLIEILIRHADQQAQLQAEREQRRHERQDQRDKITCLEAENAILRAELKRLQPERTPDDILKAAMDRLGIIQEN